MWGSKALGLAGVSQGDRNQLHWGGTVEDACQDPDNIFPNKSGRLQAPVPL